MSTLVGTLNARQGLGSGVGRFLLAFGLRITAIAAAAFLVAVVILIGLFLVNIDTLLAGLGGAQDAILIPIQDNSVLNN